MPTALLHGLSPITLNATVLAADEITPDPGVNLDLFRHSGLPYGSQALRLKIAPMVRFRTPFLGAFNLLGFRTTKLTAFSWSFRKFTDYLTDAGATHPLYQLNTGCTAAARIVGLSVDRGGLAMAEVEVVPLSTDGTTSPITNTTAALPTLGSEPTLHTLGAVVLNGTKVNGVSSIGLDLGINLTGDTFDGEAYLRTLAEVEADPTISVEHGDPITLLSSLGLTGLSASSNFDFYLRDLSAGIAQATGIRLRIASGIAVPGAIQLRRGALATTGLSLKPLSTSTTHPIVVATGQAIPAG